MKRESFPTPAAALRLLVTLAIAAGGVVVCSALGVPLPWLLGPLFACLAAALLGVPMRASRLAGESMRTVLGLAVGASITPALFDRLESMAGSVALIPPFILLIGLVGVPYFRRLCGFDPATSYYAAMPGGLQDMLVFGEEAGGDPRALSLIHATRVLVIVTLLPFLLAWWMDARFERPPGVAAAALPWEQAVLMVGLAVAGWRIALRIGLFGASILGPLILATVASLAGVLEQRPPAEAILAAQFFIGMGIGVKYAGITAAELRRIVLAAVGFTLILGALSALVAAGVIALELAPPMEALLAFAPGGQAEMAVLAIVAGADVAFVVAHHVVRIVIVIVGAPVAARWMR